MAIAPGGTLTYTGFGAGVGDLRIGYNNTNTGAATSGTFNMTGGTLIADLDEIVIGHRSGAGTGTGGATGNFTLDATANDIRANSLLLGHSNHDSAATTTGTLAMGGGTFAVAGDVTLGSRTGTAGTGTGNLILNGGTFTVGGNIVTTNSANANANITLNGATLDMTGGSISADSFLAQGGGLRDVLQLFGGDGTTPANLTKTTAGSLELSGTNAYTGTTNVDAGTLLVSGSLTGSVVNVNAGTLGGGGSITNAVTVGNSIGSADSILSPGASIGTLSTGSVTFNTDAAFTLEINTSTIETDLLASSGTVSLGLGVVPLNASDLGTANLTNSQEFTFITATGGVTGEFAGLTDGAALMVGNTQFNIDYRANSVVLVAIPEPGSLVSLLGGLGTLLGLQRFRRKTARA